MSRRQKRVRGTVLASGFRRFDIAFLGLVLSLVCAVVPSQAQSQDLKALLDRIDRLERDLGVINRGLAHSGRKTLVVPKPASMETPLAAKMSVQITALENEIRILTGKQEELQFAIEQMNRRMDKLITDMEYRLSVLEGGAVGSPPDLPPGVRGPLAPLVAPPQAVTGMSPTAPPPGNLGTLTQTDIDRFNQPSTAVPQQQTEPTSDELYRQATSLLRKADYDAAESAFAGFINKYENADEPLVSNARYWLGEIYYVRGDYGQSATVFMEGYKRDPEGRKAADSLLKLGMSLANLGNPTDACATFDKLLKEFPEASATLRDKAQRQKQKAACN